MALEDKVADKLQPLQQLKMRQSNIQSRNKHISKLCEQDKHRVNSKYLLLNHQLYGHQEFKFLIGVIEEGQIEYASFSCDQLDDQSVQLMVLQNWRLLYHLDIWMNKISCRGAEVLSKSNWMFLQALDIGYNLLGRKGAKALSKGNWCCLKQLGICGNEIGDDGVQHLSKGKWVNLAILRMAKNNLTDSAMVHLISSNWKQLSYLDMSNNEIGFQGLKVYLKADHENLSSLWIQPSQKNSLLKPLAFDIVKQKMSRLMIFQL